MIANLLGALAVRRVPWLRATPGPGPRRLLLLLLLPPQLHRSAGYSSRSYSSCSSYSSRSSNDEESCNSGSKGSYSNSSSSYSSRSNATDNSGSFNSSSSSSSSNNNSSNSDSSSGSRYDNVSCDINSCSSRSSFGDDGGTDINSSNSCSSSSGSGSDGRSSSSCSISSKSISSSSSSNIIISSNISSRRSGVSLSRRGGPAESPSVPVCRRQLLSSMAANQSKIDWNSWEKAKDQLTKLKDLEERRKYYKCSSNYIMLKSLDKWSEKELHSQDKLTELEKPETCASTVGGREYEVNHQINDKVSLFKGDITLLEIDAIVNAANSTLLGGGGVDGCIHRSAGSLLKEECRSLGGCSTGKAKITCGYRLPSKYVIHTVGPRVLDSVPTPEERKQLDGCYSECLHIVEDKELRSVAFPCISTGIYGFPNEPAARIALETTRNWLEKYHSKVDRIIFCLFLPIDVELYDTLMPVYFPRAPKESSEGVADGPAVAGTENESDDKDRDPEVADKDELKDEDMPSQDQDSAPNKTSD
ncbi:ADP-ribose glycohydrolase MACROD2-like isoform X2 [Lethenteron reissneri]|uniref:ADP-ribose glycohydrolase MACROD2-like isoform X2 n=1 Tax=Lethenteron reissneri TaxID=7753 RepID=UPI002AB6C30F|nr:ADP-ribose glycohydrolase MACROD2-like isoform X2 [Lethenteron reissneri]